MNEFVICKNQGEAALNTRDKDKVYLLGEEMNWEDI
jgi:hypothetical protein